MAYKQVAIVEAPPKETVIQRRRKGWGKEGQLVGAAIGGVVGGMAAGGSTGGWGTAAGAAGGAATGAGLGGMIGEKLRPDREEKTAFERRMSSGGPQMQQGPSATEKLKQSILALSTQPPEIKQQYMEPLVTAYAMANQQNRQGGGGMA